MRIRPRSVSARTSSLYNTKEGIGIADGAQELKGRHHMRGCHVTSFLGSSHEIYGPNHGFSTFFRHSPFLLVSRSLHIHPTPFLTCQQVACLIDHAHAAALSTNCWDTHNSLNRMQPLTLTTTRIPFNTYSSQFNRPIDLAGFVSGHGSRSLCRFS